MKINPTSNLYIGYMYNVSLKTGFKESIKQRVSTLHLSVINKSRPAKIPQKKKQITT